MPYQPTPADLELIRICAEERTLSAVAERMNREVSTISDRLRSLETRIGKKLVERAQYSSLRLTPSGTIFYRAAMEVQDRLTRLQGELNAQHPTETSLRILCSTIAMQLDLPTVARQLRDTFPDIYFSVGEASFAEIQQAVSRGECDVGLLGPTPLADSLSYHPYKTDSLVIVTPHDHPLAEQHAVSFADALGYPLIGMDTSKRITQFLEQHADNAKLPVRYGAHVSSFNAQIDWVAHSGCGIAIALESFAQHEQQRGMPIHIVKLTDDWTTGTFWICTTKDEQPAAVQKLIRILTTDDEK